MSHRRGAKVRRRAWSSSMNGPSVGAASECRMSENHAPIGLLGAGLLGLAMAERLLSQGHRVSGFDIDRDRLERLNMAGGTPCQNAAAVCANCETILLSLPTSEVAKGLIKELRPLLRKDQTVIDTTTGHPDEMVEIAAALEEQQVHYIEASVAGSSVQMRDGQALLFIGGSAGDVESVHHIIDSLAPQHFHLGPVGTASRFKLVHNLILGLHRAVLAECLTFAESLGFEPASALNILMHTPAASTVMETKGRKMAAGDREAQARLSQHLKDVRLILAEAKRSGAETPLSEVHRTLLERAVELGFGNADNSAIIEAFRPQIKGNVR